MTTPVPRGLRDAVEIARVPLLLRDHVAVLVVPSSHRALRPCRHPAKYAPGLPTALLDLAGTHDVGDPMAGSGRLAEETGLPVCLNEPDPRWWPALAALPGCHVTHDDARALAWTVDTLIFSPPYYPRCDRCRPAAHDDTKRGRPVGFRTGYGAGDTIGFIGDPGGVAGILTYRAAMREIYAALRTHARHMIVVTKNWRIKGEELRLDLDTILTAEEAGWICVARHGWTPPPSLWQRYNTTRGTPTPAIEDVIVFK